MPRGKKQNKQQEKILEKENVDVTIEKVVEPEISEEIVEPEKIIRGTVICNKLNVRKEANKDSEVLTIIPKDLVLTICDTDSSPDFYKVLIGEIEGYCIKKFIAVIVE